MRPLWQVLRLLRPAEHVITPHGVIAMPVAPTWTEDVLRNIPAVRPKASCRKCRGSGHTGWKWDDAAKARVKIPCRCVLKQLPPGYSGDMRIVRS